MPVLIVGADTPIGSALTAALASRDGEVRCFVSDPRTVTELKNHSAKVAVGDVSDGSHVGAAGLNCFSLIFITEAAFDGRERSFGDNPQTVFDQWQEAIEMSGARRVIWLEEERSIGSGASIRATEIAVVTTADQSTRQLVERLVALDEVADLKTIL